MPPSRFASREMYSRLPNMHGQEHISLFSSLCETMRWCHYDKVQDQVYILEIKFLPKKASKLPLILDNFLKNGQLLISQVNCASFEVKIKLSMT